MRTVRTSDADAPNDLAELASRARVVIFRSGLTDTRRLVNQLEAAGVAYCEITMGMGSPVERDRFHRLREWTGWSLLPQVFVDGEFAGGADDLLERAPFN
jgi:glutaredoxin-related protein